jgi:hypothetical protein
MMDLASFVASPGVRQSSGFLKAAHPSMGAQRGMAHMLPVTHTTTLHATLSQQKLAYEQA